MIDPKDEEFIDGLILSGAIEFAGLDAKTGEFLYGFTEKLKEVDANLHNKFMESFMRDVLMLWEKGFLDMDITSANPIVKLTAKAFDEREVSRLSQELRVSLINIISSMRE